MVDHQSGRVADTHTTTEHAAPSEPAPTPGQVVDGCLYEGRFSTTGTHPQGGVAIARSIDDARQGVADMMIFCDPTAAATADITAYIQTRTIARYSGTVAELFADLNTGTPGPHRPRPTPHPPHHPAHDGRR